MALLAWFCLEGSRLLKTWFPPFPSLSWIENVDEAGVEEAVADEVHFAE